jgi:hypothetical protein
MYSQLPSLAGGHPSIYNPRTRHTVVTRDSPNMELVNLTALINIAGEKSPHYRQHNITTMPKEMKQWCKMFITVDW